MAKKEDEIREKSLTDQQKVAVSRKRIGNDTPIVVSEIAEKCLYSGFFGTIDSARMKAIVDLILTVSNNSSADTIIIDLGNMDIIDSAIAGHMVKLNKLLQMVGMEVVFCGIKPIVAQSIVTAGIDIGEVDVFKNLRAALEYVYAKSGYVLKPINGQD